MDTQAHTQGHTHGYTTTFEVDRSPADVRRAINDPGAWWSEGITGHTGRVGSEFLFDIPGVHRSLLRVVESTPQRIGWEVLEARIDYVDDKEEWTGTRIEFDVRATRAGSRVDFAHVGLAPDLECFESCSNAWATLMHGSLRSLVTTGVGDPYRGASLTG